MKRIIKYLFLIIVISFISKSCDKTVSEEEIPACIENKIETIMNNNVTNPPTEVWKWVDNGATYFHITSDCCDQYNYLYNKNCKVLCSPDGGFTGKGDGNCPVFTSNIVKTLVWQDDRK
ncbi:DUF6970 domain-containing protein [Lutibacter citreus]|uniref:DUF6970 domain-containing protein n=1 Tax=Lutibacter citreus TaxID=2138210 RepID=UPI000DBE1414|nr:hypothetical protein [Lutibacter citreus]